MSRARREKKRESTTPAWPILREHFYKVMEPDLAEGRNHPLSFLEDISESTGCSDFTIMSWMAQIADPNEAQCKVLWRWVQEMANHITEGLRRERPEIHAKLMKEIGRPV